MPTLWDPRVVYDDSMTAYWDAQNWIDGTVQQDLDAAAVTGSQSTLKFSRAVPAGYLEDLAMFTLRWTINAGPGAPMSRLDSSDTTRVHAALLTWWATVRSRIGDDWTLKEVEWRHFGADFPLGTTGLVKPGPPFLVQPVGTAGTDAANARMPDQVALSITFRTASRKHWGRVYMGGLTSVSLADALKGHALASTVDLFSTAFQVLFNDLANDPRITYPVVWSPKYRGALSVNELSVDDTFDVIRRRRAKTPTYRKTYTS